MIKPPATPAPRAETTDDANANDGRYGDGCPRFPADDVERSAFGSKEDDPRFARPCPEYHNGWACCRALDHDGDHVAGNGTKVLDRWPRAETTDEETRPDPLRRAVEDLLTKPAIVTGVPSPYKEQTEAALRQLQDYLRVALAARPSGHEDDPGAEDEAVRLRVALEVAADGLRSAATYLRHVQAFAFAEQVEIDEQHARRSLVSGGANKADDPEARLRAFVERYSADAVAVRYDPHAPPTEEPWSMGWRRRYPDGVVSDWREVEASSFAGLVSAAEEWEAENDRREPEHAPRPSPGAPTEGE